MERSDIINRSLAACEEKGGSDLHLKAGMQPILRRGSTLTAIDAQTLSDDDIICFANSFLTDDQKEEFDKYHEVDAGFSHGDFRYRCNYYLDASGAGMSLRRVALHLDSFSNLGIPEVLMSLALKKSGLLLVTGPTGCGKSTTLSCIINYLNHKINAHIITLEDPIEYRHTSNTCLITQRELGSDTTSYSRGLKAAMRQDPDVIMLGEMRDLESISTAISAAETGHLVLSTLHTRGAENTVDRIIDMFPAGQQNQVRVQLSMTMLGVVSQQLVPTVEEGKRVLATEVMLGSNAIKNLIRGGKTHMITSQIQTSRNLGMYSMNGCLQELYDKGIITKENQIMYSFDVQN